MISSEYMMQILAYARRTKKIEYAVALIATAHMIPLTSILTPLADFAYDTCKLECPLELMALQALLSVLLMLGVLTRNSDFVFPFMCMFFGIYVLFVPYNFIELLPKTLSMPESNRFPVKRLAPIILGISNGMIILSGLILHYYYEMLLKEKFGSVSLVIREKKPQEVETNPHENQQGQISIKIHLGIPKPSPQTNQQ